MASTHQAQLAHVDEGPEGEEADSCHCGAQLEEAPYTSWTPAQKGQDLRVLGCQGLKFLGSNVRSVQGKEVNRRCRDARSEEAPSIATTPTRKGNMSKVLGLNRKADICRRSAM